MYNLAHLYFYENPIENSIQESIKLLITSSNKNHYESIFLLCIISIKEFGNSFEKIIQNLMKFESFSTKLASSMYRIIEYNKLYQPSVFNSKYAQYRYIDFIFDFEFFFSDFSKHVYFLKNGNIIKEENHQENINSDFFEGFGIL